MSTLPGNHVAIPMSIFPPAGYPRAICFDDGTADGHPRHSSGHPRNSTWQSTARDRMFSALARWHQDKPNRVLRFFDHGCFSIGIGLAFDLPSGALSPIDTRRSVSPLAPLFTLCRLIACDANCGPTLPFSSIALLGCVGGSFGACCVLKQELIRLLRASHHPVSAFPVHCKVCHLLLEFDSGRSFVLDCCRVPQREKRLKIAVKCLPLRHKRPVCTGRSFSGRSLRMGYLSEIRSLPKP